MNKYKSKYLRLAKNHNVIKIKFKDKILHLTFKLYEHSKLVCIFTSDKKDFCLYTGALKDVNSLKLMIERFYARS